MIALTFALPQESKTLCAELREATEHAGAPLPILTGRIGRREVVICHTGIGASSATRQLQKLAKLRRPRGLIAAGFAGGLDPKLQTGNVLVATNFSNDALLSLTRHVCDDFRCCYFGTLTTQPRAAETVEEKAALAFRTSASAVDMETAAIAAGCETLSVPMLSVRAISDDARSPLPVPFPVWFDMEKQTPRPGALLAFLAAHPARILPFVRFVRGVNEARAQLTKYLLRLLAEM